MSVRVIARERRRLFVVEKKRDLSVSFLRVFGIILVVLGHSSHAFSSPWVMAAKEKSYVFDLLTRYIYSFHMPLFVFISGYLYFYLRKELSKYPDYEKFVKEKFKRLMIPYFLIAFFYRFPIQLLTKVDINGNLGKEFVGILVGINSGHLWFLFMLFFLFSAFYLLEDFFSKIGSLYSLITLSIVSIVSIYFSNYLQFHSILFYLVFFYFGYLLKSREEILSIKNNFLWFVFFFLLHLGVFTYSIFQTYSPLLAQFLSLILGFLGILFSYQFSKIVLSAIDLSKFKTFNFLDNNSMIIYLFHEPIIFIILSKVGTYTWHSTFTVLICFFGSFLISSMIAYFIPRSQFLANTLKV